jgi:hypothetical protein
MSRSDVKAAQPPAEAETTLKTPLIPAAPPAPCSE